MSFLYWLESIRCDFLDKFFGTITKFGDETIMLVICIIALWCINKKYGYYIISTCFIGLIINQALKMICRVPRPWVRDPQFTIVESAKEAATSYSFPSGHTQNIVAGVGTVARFTRNLIIRIVCIALVVLVALSRMYLGVHTPADVLVSLLIGTVLVFGLFPIFEKSDEKPKPVYITLGIMTAMSLIFTIVVSLYNWPADVVSESLAETIKNGYMATGSSLAILISFYVDRNYVKSETKAVWWFQIIKVVVGLALVLAIKEGMKPLMTLIFDDHPVSSAIRYFMIVLFAGLIWPAITTKIARKIEKRG